MPRRDVNTWQRRIESGQKLLSIFVGVEHDLLHVFGLAVTGFEETAANRPFFP